MITVTEKARAKAIQYAERDAKPPIMRIGVQGGGCSGLSYVLNFVDQEDHPQNDNDEVLHLEGLTLLCDRKSLKFLNGMTLDYHSNLMGGGFRFNNPNAKRSCSCGESFAV